MLSKLNFKKTTLTLSVNSILQWNNEHKRFGLSILLMLMAQQGFAQVTQPNSTITEAEFQQQLKNEAIQQEGVGSRAELEIGRAHV